MNLFQIWDTAGQERYKSIAKVYYQKSQAIIFVYDITNKESFKKLKEIYYEVKDARDITKVRVFIVGNKNDLYSKEEITKNEGKEYAKTINGTYRCVSALTSDGILELFECIGKTLLLGKDENETKEEEGNNAIVLTNKDNNKGKNGKNGKNGKKCC